YAKSVRPASGWEGRFAALFAAQVGPNVVIGSMNSNRLRVYNRHTATSRWFEVGDGRFPPLTWPSDALLERGATRQTVAELVRACTCEVALGRPAASGGRGGRGIDAVGTARTHLGLPPSPLPWGVPVPPSYRCLLASRSLSFSLVLSRSLSLLLVRSPLLRSS